MNYNKEIRKLMELLGEVDDLNPFAAMGAVPLLADLDLDILNDVISKPDKDQYMKSLLLLAVALGAEHRCQGDIDKMYQSDEKAFFHFYSKTGIGKTKIFDKFSITTSECIKKCFGIILSEEFGKESRGVPLFIQRLIKKAYKPVFTFNMHKKWNMLEEFIPWYEEKIGGVDKISGIYLDRSCYVLKYLAYKDNKILFPTEMFNVIDEHFDYLVANPNLEDVTKVEEELTKGYQELIAKMTFKNQISEDVSYIFENIRLLEEQELIGNSLEPQNLKRIRETLVKMPLTRITNALLVTMETFGLSGDFLKEARIGNKLLEEMAKFIYIIKNSNKLTERESEILFLVALVIYAIASEYNNLRKDFYEGLKVKIQEQEVEEEKREAALEEKYQIEIAAIREKLRTANETVSSLKTVHNNKENTIKQMEKEQKRLNAELTKAKDNDKELQFLREFYFNSQTEHKVSEDISIESIENYLKSIKGVIVGGHTNLTKKLKEKLPKFDFVAEEETSRNLSFMRNKEIVFISSVHDNHGLYEKVVREISNADIVLTYLEKYQNVDLLLRDIYKKCLEKL